MIILFDPEKLPGSSVVDFTVGHESFRRFWTHEQHGAWRRQAASSYPLLAHLLPVRPALRNAIDTGGSLQQVIAQMLPERVKAKGENEFKFQPSKGRARAVLNFAPPAEMNTPEVRDAILRVIGQMPPDWTPKMPPPAGDPWTETWEDRMTRLKAFREQASFCFCATIATTMSDSIFRKVEDLVKASKGNWYEFLDRMMKAARIDTRPEHLDRPVPAQPVIAVGLGVIPALAGPAGLAGHVPADVTPDAPTDAQDEALPEQQMAGGLEPAVKDDIADLAKLLLQNPRGDDAERELFARMSRRVARVNSVVKEASLMATTLARQVVTPIAISATDLSRGILNRLITDMVHDKASTMLFAEKSIPAIIEQTEVWLRLRAEAAAEALRDGELGERANLAAVPDAVVDEELRREVERRLNLNRNPKNNRPTVPILINGEPLHNYVIDNVAFVWLADDHQLVEEGAYFGHCVGGYGDDCRSGRSFIFSARDLQGNRLSTLQLYTRVCGDVSTLMINQLYGRERGRGNEDPAPYVQVAANKFLEALRGNKLEIGEGLFKGHDQVSAQAGYDWRDAEQINLKLTAWRDFCPALRADLDGIQASQDIKAISNEFDPRLQGSIFFPPLPGERMASNDFRKSLGGKNEPEQLVLGAPRARPERMDQPIDAAADAALPEQEAVAGQEAGQNVALPQPQEPVVADAPVP